MAKSLELTFHEALAAIDKAGRRNQFNEKVRPEMTIETRLNVAEAVLADVVVKRVKESAPIKKHNGASDNFVEGNPFGPSVIELRESSNYSAGYVKETADKYGKGDKSLFDGLLKLGKITEAEHKQLTGAKPAAYEALSEQKKRDFDFARAVGLTEAQAFSLVQKTGSTFKEVSR